MFDKVCTFVSSSMSNGAPNITKQCKRIRRYATSFPHTFRIGFRIQAEPVRK